MDPTVVVEPLTSSSSNASIQSMLDTVMTAQAVHGQLLLKVLIELQAL